MRYLYKTSAIIGVIILIEFLKWIVDAIWVFRPLHTFFVSLQLVLLLWLAVSLILDAAVFRNLPARKAIQKSTLVVVVTLLISELFTIFLLHHPRYIPRQVLPLFQGYYDIFERDIVQINPNSGRYDSSLFYTLIPAKKFSFNNLEFHTAYHTNSKGLRDDEMSLEKPEVIVLGDSYGMGWGVQQNETFAHQVEKMTGKKVLNAAISSYGTARELKNLYRLDTSGLRYLIIQYCENDVYENKPFVMDDYQLQTSSVDKYEKAVQTQYWSKQYFPGKRFTTLTRLYIQRQLYAIGEKIFPKPAARLKDSNEATLEEAAQYFLDILYNSSLNFEKIKVFVININSLALNDDKFVGKAKSLKHQFKYEQKFKTNLLFIPSSKIFNKEDYYILDPHLRPSGHKKIAALLTTYLTQQSPNTAPSVSGDEKTLNAQDINLFIHQPLPTLRKGLN